MQYKEPCCDNCGAKFYRIYPYDKYNPMLGKIPSHCSKCGTKISIEKRAQIDKFTIFFCCLIY